MFAQDQYVSVAGFTVRTDEASQSTDLFGGMATQLAGSPSQTDTDMLYEFLHSPALALYMEEKHSLSAKFSKHWPKDPVFSLWPNPSAESLTDYWQRIVTVSYDQSSRLMEIRVHAYDPALAQAIAQTVLERCQNLLNDINQVAQNATMRVAEITLERSEMQLRDAREALIRFQTKTSLIDPQADLEGRFITVTTLQQKLADILVLTDMLEMTTTEDDPRLKNAQREAQIIRNRIKNERNMVVSDAQGADGAAYPDLLARHEQLVTDREIAEQSHAAALSSYEMAQTDAMRQSRYLAVYIQPSLPETSRYPMRWTLLGLVILFAFLGWTVVTIVAYSIRDSRIS